MRSFLVIILFSFSGKLISQDAAKDLDHVYGLDPLLYNGKQYTYFLPPGIGGHQFLNSTDYYVGDVTIKGSTFDGITLNYDIFNQLLLLRYASESGAFNIIGISTAWLERFRLGDLEFKYMSFDDGPRFYQILGDGPLFILYYWRKDLKLDASYGATHFAFTPPLKNRYVLISGKLMPFKNKRSLISLFNPENKQEIKDFIRSNRIKMNEASDQVMTELINYIDNLK